MIAGPAAPLIATGVVLLILAGAAYAIEHFADDLPDENADWLGVGSDGGASMILPHHDEGDAR